MSQSKVAVFTGNHTGDTKVMVEEMTMKSLEHDQIETWARQHERFVVPSKRKIKNSHQLPYQSLEIQKSSQPGNNDQSFNHTRISSESFAERSTSEQFSRNSFSTIDETQRISEQDSSKQKFPKNEVSIRHHLRLSVFTLLFLSAAAVLITIGALIGSRTNLLLTTTSSTISSTSSTSSTTTSTSSTSATTTSTSSTSTSSTTTTTTGITKLTTTSETVYAVWNTSAGQDSTPSTNGSGVGNFSPDELPEYAFDNTTSTKYANDGNCASGGSLSSICGVDTGLYVTPERGPSSLLTVQFCTANNLPNRDPIAITIEGSNQPSSFLTLGSSWALIYNGSTGLDSFTTRLRCGSVVSVSNNSDWYSSYRVLVTSVRGSETATHFSELRLVGYQ